MIQNNIATKQTFLFGASQGQHQHVDAELLGNKGLGLYQMSSIGIAVPPGFTIPSQICNYYYQNDKTLPPELTAQIAADLKIIGQTNDTQFGDKNTPLIISVRSGAAVSMPGMMDTILNIGLNDAIVKQIASNPTKERFILDCYRRLIQMFAIVVFKIRASEFEEIIDLVKIERKYTSDSELTPENLKSLIIKFKEVIREETGADFPQDVYCQLHMAIKGVFDSWMSSRAITYRKINKISSKLGTAVTAQAMVFGNYSANSGTGVLFSRNPSTGAKELFGEFLRNAQGEDVVSGIRTPLSLQEAINSGALSQELYVELKDIACKLETYFKDMQDIEFTIEDGKLWILQTRNAKRSAQSMIKIAYDMAQANIITKSEAIRRIDTEALTKLLHPSISTDAMYEIFAKGLAASPGAVSGSIVFTAEEAEHRAKTEKVILVRHETCPEDIGGMHAAEGILTCKGGMTSHAAVVARGMGKPCICGASEIYINAEKETIKCGNITLNAGDVITINGETGEVILGVVPTIQPSLSEELKAILSWAHEIKTLAVRANSETPQDTMMAQKFTAEGIGLCRTEHMFFDSARINIMRQMILASNRAERLKSLEKLLPMQTEDFESILRIMNSKPVTIRLLDPPFNEFINRDNIKNIAELAQLTGTSEDKILTKIKEIAEHNPMLGHRGCRLAITYPEIYQMQVAAIFTAISNLLNEGLNPIVEIMIPIVLAPEELAILSTDINQHANQFGLEQGTHFKIGTMIELPRACLIAEQIAQHTNFCSFGTNDLTQTVFGISRDDSANYLPQYLEKQILNKDPFIEIDRDSVGALMKIAVQKIRNTNPDIKIGICGEHGGNPASIEFFNEIGLDYISCSPYRIPVAIIAAAKAAIAQKNL
jgi:pyruvate,orthophosphate dikinase